jgi:hypothetical protein
MLPNAALNELQQVTNQGQPWQAYEACPKVSDFIFPRKTSDGRLANLITGLGGTFIHMRGFLRHRPVRLSHLGS